MTTDEKDRKNVKVIIPSKKLTVTERQRIEKLIDGRYDDLCSHVRVLKTEASDEINLNKENETTLTEAKAELDGIISRIDLLEGEYNRDWEETKLALDKIQQDYTDRVERRTMAWEEKHRDKTAVMLREHNEKQDKCIANLSDKRFELEEKIRIERIRINQENYLQQVVADQRIDTLKDGLSDARTAALESLWIEEESAEVARKALGCLPGAREFKIGVSAHSFLLTTDEITEVIEENELVCRKCGSTDINIAGSMKCRKCGQYNCVKISEIKSAALKNIYNLIPALKPLNTPLLEGTNNGQ